MEDKPALGASSFLSDEGFCVGLFLEALAAAAAAFRIPLRIADDDGMLDDRAALDAADSSLLGALLLLFSFFLLTVT